MTILFEGEIVKRMNILVTCDEILLIGETLATQNTRSPKS
jgi:hypothetical protein